MKKILIKTALCASFLSLGAQAAEKHDSAVYSFHSGGQEQGEDFLARIGAPRADQTPSFQPSHSLHALDGAHGLDTDTSFAVLHHSTSTVPAASEFSNETHAASPYSASGASSDGHSGGVSQPTSLHTTAVAPPPPPPVRRPADGTKGLHRTPSRSLADVVLSATHLQKLSNSPAHLSAASMPLPPAAAAPSTTTTPPAHQHPSSSHMLRSKGMWTSSRSVGSDDGGDDAHLQRSVSSGSADFSASGDYEDGAATPVMGWFPGIIANAMGVSVVYIGGHYEVRFNADNPFTTSQWQGFVQHTQAQQHNDHLTLKASAHAVATFLHTVKENIDQFKTEEQILVAIEQMEQLIRKDYHLIIAKYGSDKSVKELSADDAANIIYDDMDPRSVRIEEDATYNILLPVHVLFALHEKLEDIRQRNHKYYQAVRAKKSSELASKYSALLPSTTVASGAGAGAGAGVAGGARQQHAVMSSPHAMQRSASQTSFNGSTAT